MNISLSENAVVSDSPVQLVMQEFWRGALDICWRMGFNAFFYGACHSETKSRNILTSDVIQLESCFSTACYLFFLLVFSLPCVKLIIVSNIGCHGFEMG